MAKSNKDLIEQLTSLKTSVEPLSKENSALEEARLQLQAQNHALINQLDQLRVNEVEFKKVRSQTLNCNSISVYHVETCT